MKNRKVLDKLEQELAHFMINEFCKKDPTKRGAAEMYKYKGLNIIADTKTRAKEKTVSIRIGALEAEFKVENGDKTSGALTPEEEKMIYIWMNQNETNYALRSIFGETKINKRHIKIIPFDLENVL